MNTTTPNPVIKVTPLRAYPGWSIREYADGTFDASHAIALSPVVDSWRAALAHVKAEEALGAVAYCSSCGTPNPMHEHAAHAEWCGRSFPAASFAA